ncbi:MAG TPA: nucleotidyltransferase domain-containing protein [Solirubrobacterales bacterium]|nr:nucleotidyltransferase domain-containing protein [Solirubrobacterales bacterium]
MTALDDLAARSEGGFPNLVAAREQTEAGLSGLGGRLAGVEVDADAAVVLFGSWGRGEVTDQSDYDWAVLVDGAERAGVRPFPAEVEAALGMGAKGPGAEGIFGASAFCDHLVDRIGLDADDNTNLSRRMLLLLESVGIVHPVVRDRCRDRVLRGYLDESVEDFRPPRFFLNDLIRYWRTICVDYVGKERRGGDDRKWALRDLKLRTSRKILFAGGLLPILLCHRLRVADMEEYLRGAFDRPSLDRIASAFLELAAVDAGLRAVGAYDRFLGLIADPSVREELAGVTRATAAGSPVFEEGRRLGREIEAGLQALLFETRIEPLVREYGIL